MPEQYRSEPQDPDRHDVTNFTCGEQELDGWLRDYAAAASERNTARTWVWVDDRDRVVGYYALAAHKVARERVASSFGRGGPAEIPAVLLANLAVATHFRGKGLGSVLVADALDRIIGATRVVAVRLVVVDALTERVAQFYETLGFRRIPGSLLLVQRISDIESALRG